MARRPTTTLVSTLLGLLLPALVPAAPRPGPSDLCPVCGMLVSKYPTWPAALVWKYTRVQYFDAAKDLFTALAALGKYAPGRTRAELVAIEVTDFYELVAIDARTAFFVEGSDVLGPMGAEYVPHATRAAAEEFLRDHKGRRILRFEEIEAELAGAPAPP